MKRCMSNIAQYEAARHAGRYRCILRGLPMSAIGNRPENYRRRRLAIVEVESALIACCRRISLCVDERLHTPFSQIRSEMMASG